VPGATAHYGDLRFAGSASGAKLAGTFRVSILDDLVHLLMGAAGLAAARTAGGARGFLNGSGVLLLSLWFLGAAGIGGWLPLNAADNWLHFLLGVGLLGLGFAVDGDRVRTRAS
jgi:Domain of unknown function (DUF4383)